MTDRAVLPDVLSLYPAGSIVIWTNKKWSDRPHQVVARVIGRSPHGGNERLHLRVLSIRKTPIGPVLFWLDKPEIKITNIISIEEYYKSHGKLS